MIFDILALHPPEKIALQDLGRAISYGDLAHEIGSRAQALEPVRVLGIALDNSVDWILWDLAALKAGVPCVPLPPFFTDDQIRHSLRCAGVSHILSSEGLKDTGLPARDIPAGTAKITFTSGTTGTPKGVCLPQRAMEDVAGGIVEMLGADFSGVHCSVLPLGILLENVAGVYTGLMAGATIILSGLEEFGAQYTQLHQRLKETGATSIILVPEILRLLMKQVMALGSLPTLKFIAVGGSKVDPALIKQARDLGLPVYEGYGLSECASVVSLNTPNADKPGSVGTLLPHVRLRVVDGEIQIKQPGYLGCIGEPAPDVLKTGDLGAMDEDGFLSITGRKKNVLITSYGRNVSPEWVEAGLLAQAEIAQVIVYGDARPHLSALIVPASTGVNIVDAIERANKTLPDYAQVRGHQIIAPFTTKNGLLTGNGRLRREVIFTHYAELLHKEKNDELLQPAG